MDGRRCPEKYEKLGSGPVLGIPVRYVFLAERGVTNRPGSGVHLGSGIRGPNRFVQLGLFGRVPWEAFGRAGLDPSGLDPWVTVQRAVLDPMQPVPDFRERKSSSFLRHRKLEKARQHCEYRAPNPSTQYYLGPCAGITANN